MAGSLVESGAARMEKLGLGLEFDRYCALVDDAGDPSARINGIGPVTLGTFWESIGRADIREQARLIATASRRGGRTPRAVSAARLPYKQADHRSKQGQGPVSFRDFGP